MPEHLILIRHFATDAPKQGAFYGSTDLSLKAETATSSLQAVIEEQNIPKIYCSPKKRCRQTADIYFPDAVKVYLEKAVETDFGEWEGMTFAEIAAQYPEEIDRWHESDFSFPGGESVAAFEERISDLIDIMYDSGEKTFVLVAHAGIIRYLLCSLLGIDKERSLSFQVDPGSLTYIRLFENRMGVLSALNEKGRFLWPK